MTEDDGFEPCSFSFPLAGCAVMLFGSLAFIIIVLVAVIGYLYF